MTIKKDVKYFIKSILKEYQLQILSLEIVITSSSVQKVMYIVGVATNMDSLDANNKKKCKQKESFSRIPHSLPSESKVKIVN